MRHLIGLNLKFVPGFLWLLGLAFPDCPLHAQSRGVAVGVTGSQSTFQPSFQETDFQTGCGDVLSAGDFNGDGNPDFLVLCAAASQVYVYLGKGDGTFQAPVMTSFAQVPIFTGDQMVTADVNADGKTDLVYSGFGPAIKHPDCGAGTTTGTFTLTVMLSNGDGTFSPPNTVVPALDQTVSAAADLNGDGIPDLVVDGGEVVGPPGILLGKGDGTFSPLTLLPLPQNVVCAATAVADFNGDGKPDIMMYLDGSLSDNMQPVWTLLNQGGGSFAAPVPAATATSRSNASYLNPTLLTADFNGDGKLDLGVYVFLGSSTYAFDVFLGNGNGTFQPNTVGGLELMLGAFAPVDLNGDGEADLAQAVYETPYLVSYLSNGDGTFQTLPNEIGIDQDFLTPLVVADFNKDGKPDLADISLGGRTIGAVVLINTSDIPALGLPASVAILSGNNQTGNVGTQLQQPLIVKVINSSGTGVGGPGITVNFAVTSGAGTVSAAHVQTNPDGTASVLLTLGATGGPVTVTASITGSSIAPVHFTATAANPACPIGPPSIATVNYATDYGAFSNFASGSYLEVKGANLALDSRQWASSDFNGSNAPTSLDGSKVSIDGFLGYVSYISGQQINVQAPADPATGMVPIVVSNCAGTSNTFQFQKNAIAPGMLAPASFNVGKQYLVALFASDLAQGLVTYVGNTGLIAGANFRPATPGDVIIVFGLGFGDVSPVTPPGVIASGATSLTGLSISFGSTPVTNIAYAGLYPGFVGLYEFYLTVPSVATGDSQINISIGGTLVPQTLYLTVQ